MKLAALLGTLLVCVHVAGAQEAEIVEAQRRLAIINAGSRQGLLRSDTLWVTGFIGNGDHLIAKAKVIALRKRHSAIEAFQFFGPHGLAVGQVVHRVKELPAPLTAPPKRSAQNRQRPELTLADLYGQWPRIFVFAGGMADDVSWNFTGGVGARLPFSPGVQITLSGRYVALGSSKAAQRSAGDAKRDNPTSMLVIAAGFRPLSRIVILEVGFGLYQTHTRTNDSGPGQELTLNDFGLAASIGKHLKLSERVTWIVQAGFHFYFPDDGERQFLSLDVQCAF